MSGQGRVAVGAIAGASVVALVCIGFTGGLAPRSTTTNAVPGDVPVVMTADPGITPTTQVVQIQLTSTSTAATTIANTTTTTSAHATHSSASAPPSTHSVASPTATTQTQRTTPVTTTAAPTTTTCMGLFC